MAEGEGAHTGSPVAKRKLEDLEAEAPKPEASPPTSNDTRAVNGNSDGVEEATEEASPSEAPDVKRQRVEVVANGLDFTHQEVVTEPPQQDVKAEGPSEDESQPSSVGNAHETTDEKQLSAKNMHLDETARSPTDDKPEFSTELPPDVDSVPSEQSQLESGETSRKIEVPNTKVGVLIGKAGDTIRFLQYNSGAKIQITRDVDADPYSSSRLVELIGSVDSISKAEQLIKDVIAEADAGGSPSLVARGFGTVQPGAEEVQIQVPNEKVGLIIGKGGETIKSLQTRSGARIQLVPQHLPDGDQSKERTIRVTGNKKQIEIAREMIKEVMNQIPVRPSSLSGGYSQQAFRPRASPGVPHWGPPRGPPPGAQATSYDYQRRGMYAQQTAQYPPQSYGGYAHQPPPRAAFNTGWEQRPAAPTQGPPSQSGAYDYYGQGGPPPTSAPIPGPAATHPGYNYGPPQGPDYGQPPNFSQSGPPQQTYENQTPSQHPYGPSQTGYAPPANAPSGYTQPYGRPVYGMAPAQGPGTHSYGPPRAVQPGDMQQQYQGPPTNTTPYASSGPTSQHPYPYGPTGTSQQPYPYGQAPSVADGYTQPTAIPASGYNQQGGAAYGQTGSAPVQTGYVQGGQATGYAQYPPTQTGYGEQQASGNPSYAGYQTSADASYNAAPASAYGPPNVQTGYAQPPVNPSGYDQSLQQSGYGTAGTAPVAYGKSPQTGYGQYAGTAPDGQQYGQAHN